MPSCEFLASKAQRLPKQPRLLMALGCTLELCGKTLWRPGLNVCCWHGHVNNHGLRLTGEYQSLVPHLRLRGSERRQSHLCTDVGRVCRKCPLYFSLSWMFILWRLVLWILVKPVSPIQLYTISLSPFLLACNSPAFGLERWLSSYEHWVLFWRSWVQIPATTWWLTTICNEICLQKDHNHPPSCLAIRNMYCELPVSSHQ